jgi:hypothetical protein
LVKQSIITKLKTKKRLNFFTTSISSIFGSIILLKKYEPQPKELFEDLALLIIKNHLPMQFVESVWLKRFAIHLCPRLLFSSRK